MGTVQQVRDNHWAIDQLALVDSPVATEGVACVEELKALRAHSIHQVLGHLLMQSRGWCGPDVLSCECMPAVQTGKKEGEGGQGAGSWCVKELAQVR